MKRRPWRVMRRCSRAISEASQSPMPVFLLLALALALPLGAMWEANRASLNVQDGVVYSPPPPALSASASAKHHHHHRHWPIRYTVQPSDSLSGIAKRFYGTAADWPWIWQANQHIITSPPLIPAGVTLTLTRITGPIPAPPQPAAPPATTSAAVAPAAMQAIQATPAPQPVPSASPVAGGAVLTAAQVGQLWLTGGGSPAAEMTAECIAMAESGGNTMAVSPTSDYGLFQEHNRPDVLGSATASTQLAIQMSGNGTNWSAWTTAGGCGA